MGPRGTMIVEKEQKVFLYPENDPTKKKGDPKGTAGGVTTTSAGKPALDSGGDWGGAFAAPICAAPAGRINGEGSRGDRAGMEDFAFLVRTRERKLAEP